MYNTYMRPGMRKPGLCTQNTHKGTYLHYGYKF